MKLIANTKEIQTAFKNLLKVIPSKSSIVILENIYITANDDRVELIAADLDITAKVMLKDADVIEQGDALLGKDTVKLISKLKDDQIIITDQTIESGKRTINYIAADIETYPMVANRNYSKHAFTITHHQKAPAFRHGDE